jgi:hypothetical protein
MISILPFRAEATSSTFLVLLVAKQIFMDFRDGLQKWGLEVAAATLLAK